MRERGWSGMGWRQKQNGSFPSSEKLQRNMVAILFSHRYVALALCSLSLSLCVCVFRYCCVFLFIPRPSSFFFRFSVGRVGALMATSSLPRTARHPPSAKKFPSEFRALFSFIYIWKATPHGKKLLSRRTADVFTHFDANHA